MAFHFKEVGLFILATIIFIQVRDWYRWRTLKKWGEKEGCGDVPLMHRAPWGIDRLVKIIYKGINGMDFLEDIIRKNYTEAGSYTYRAFGLFNSSGVNTADPVNIQAILATKFDDYDLGPVRSQNFHELFGDGIFTAEGGAWAHYRRQLKPQFTRDQVSDLEAADRHLHTLFKALPEENAEGWIQEVDIMPFIYRFTMDVSTEFLFGESVDSQTTALHSLDSGNMRDAQKDMNFAEALNFAQGYVGWRITLGPLHSLFSSKQFKEACRIANEYAGRFVTKALDPNHKKAATSPGQEDKFVLLNALVAETRNPNELRNQVLHVLVAGRDTTSALLCWTILLLGRDQAAFKHLRQEIISHFGTEQQPSKDITFASLKACKAINNVLQEALRLYPIVPINGRVANKDTILPTGGGRNGKQPIAVRKGENIGYATYVMQRRHDIWGPDADEFRPGRWEGRKLGWEMIPFSGGPRVCLGQQYALNEASFVLVKLLQRYDVVEALNMTGKLEKALTLTVAPAGGVKVRLHRASA